jgi:hypothetical protein
MCARVFNNVRAVVPLLTWVEQPQASGKLFGGRLLELSAIAVARGQKEVIIPLEAVLFLAVVEMVHLHAAHTAGPAIVLA